MKTGSMHRAGARSKLRLWIFKAVLLLLLVVSPVVLYLLAAWGLGSIPANRSFQEPATGVEIFVWSNGVHTDLVFPVRHEAMNWLAWLGPSPMESPTNNRATENPTSVHVSHMAFGWGDRGFFLDVPEWRDLTFKVALNALVLDGEAAMHVTWLESPPAVGRYCRRVMVTEEQYRLLVDHVRQSFKPGPDERPVRIKAAGYGDNDAFFEAGGHYGPINTCNEWTGRGLRNAGVRTGVWTPFEGAVTKHLPVKSPVN